MATEQQILDSVHLPPNNDHLKATLAYGRRALGRLVCFEIETFKSKVLTTKYMSFLRQSLFTLIKNNNVFNFRSNLNITSQ